MKLTKSNLSITSLLVISLLQVPSSFAAGAAGANAGAGAGGTGVSAGGNAGVTTGGNTGVNAGANAGVTPNGNNTGVPNSNGVIPPPTNRGSNPSPVDAIRNNQSNQPIDPSRDINRPVDPRNARGSTVAPAAPANNCYTVDGQPTTATNCSPTSPPVR